ncbi:uncharacterized protein UV8b_06468 [Ustilaginoidea virens]|nr:uncharacterized protein UV8b_06468 [Ustilaginoidea virens]QUC22227.1 hypothetical protein UV8b_06468 [Ustilaginoidea virens]
MSSGSRSRVTQWSARLHSCIRQLHAGAGGQLGPSAGSLGRQSHGEKIWVFSHRRSEQTIYSLEDKLDGFHALKQLPFNGKKTKPAKLRKDYWAPMAMIQFPQGQGEVGRSVYQKLRELKHLHEVAWPKDFRYKRPQEFTEADKKKIAEEKEKGRDYKPVRTKAERGIALNAQKKNAIADMATVLGGHGSGNKVAASPASHDDQPELVHVSISWANDEDKNYAESWSTNVSHELLNKPVYNKLDREGEREGESGA